MTTDRTFTAGQRVHLDGFGAHARFLNYEPSYDGSGQVNDPIGYSRVELEDCNGRIAHAPTSSVRAAEATA